MASDQAMQMLRQFSDEGRAALNRTLNDTRIVNVKASAQNLWNELLELLRSSKETLQTIAQISNPQILAERLKIIFRNEIARNNLFYVFIGLSIGTTCGYFIGTWIARPNYPSPVMKAIACVAFRETDNVIPTLVKVPSLCSPTDLLVRVRASSIHRVDERIINGYGRTLRRMIQNYNRYDHQEMPLVIGRACAGIVEGVGRNSKSGLEIGDEVWLASPWYEAGVASQLVVAPETRISRKPFIIGFEGAASLPYSGCAALTALEAASLDETNSGEKRVLILDGCSPVGCVLTQLLKKWGTFVTATCNVRSVPVIQALAVRSGGRVIDTVEKRMSSDDYGFFMRILCSFYVKLEKSIACVFKFDPDWGGPHICHRSLDRLAGYVNDGILQTVVDQVYTPDDAEKAVAHICSAKPIGGTIVTFRS